VPFMSNIGSENFLERAERGKKYGVYVGIVTDNKDPDGKYRVRVRIPSQANGDASGTSSESTFWYRICTFGAGDNRGMYNMPEVNDEVLLAFENGEVSHGYVVGTLWNKTCKVIDANSDGDNNDRWYRSRTGSMLKFSDKKDKTSILVQSSVGHKVFLDDDKPGTILVQHSSGNTKITLLEKDIKIESTGDTIVDCDNFKLTAKTNIEMKSGADTKITASANIKGQASSNIELQASGMGKFVSSGTMTIQGAMVNIN
jgi:uncharacterized protein involved in type VI secretion and phage assembly